MELYKAPPDRKAKMDYKQPYNTKPGEGKMGHHSTSHKTGMNPGQKMADDIPHNFVMADGSPEPTRYNRR